MRALFIFEQPKDTVGASYNETVKYDLGKIGSRDFAGLW
jgi:hypothetical protein